MGLKHTEGKVVIKINIESKNSHRFEDGTTIRLERQWNNLNKRETEPVNAYVISGDGIPEGAEILIHPNVVHDSYKIHNYTALSGEKIASDWRYYSIPQEQCFLYRDGETWLPLKGYAIGQRVYKPYDGLIMGIMPTKIKDVLYIETGKFKGQIVHTLKASDYEIIFQGTNGQEQRIIRCRHYENEDGEREEIIAINHELTKKANKGELLIGNSVSTAKPVQEYACL